MPQYGDDQNNPTSDDITARIWELYDHRDHLITTLAEWSAAQAPTPSELSLRDQKVAELRRELAEIDRLLDEAETTPSNPTVGTPEWRRHVAKAAADARHNQRGGFRDKKRKIREIWASGKYTVRNQCAEREHDKLGITYRTARKYLDGTPDPK